MYNSYPHQLNAHISLRAGYPCRQLPIGLSRKPDPTNPSTDHFQYDTRGRKGLVTFGRIGVLHLDCRVDNLIGHGHMTLS